MMGPRQVAQGSLFYEFNLEALVPEDHLLRSIDRFVDLSGVRDHLAPFYSSTGRPSIDPELMIRMLIVGYTHGIRSERRLCEEVRLNLAYRWFCRLDLTDPIPNHSSFSKNRHGRFRDSDLFRKVFEDVVARCISEGLVGGANFAADASLIQADANKMNSTSKEEWDRDAINPETAPRAVVEFPRPEGRHPMHPDFRHYDSTRTPREPFIRYERVVSPDDLQRPEGYLFQPEFADRLETFERGEWHFVSIRARAEIHIPHPSGASWTTYAVDSAGIHGVESDAGEDYHAMLYDEEVESLKADLASFAIAVATAA